jgi:hypothetical protein
MFRNRSKLTVGFLIAVSALALTQALAIAPSYALLSASKTHGAGPPDQGVTTSTLANPQSLNSDNGNGRRGTGVPPGLKRAWAHSNMSVVAMAVTHAIFLNGTHGVELAEIAINASSSGQLIRDVAFNESVVEIDLDHEGSLELTVNSSAKPSAIFADDMQLSEAQSTMGLIENSNAWVYDQNSHMIIIFADPSSVTMFYNPIPTPEFPTALAALLLVGSVAATTLMIKARPTRRIKK